MGLTTWKNAPQGKILSRCDGREELPERATRSSELNRIVSMYLDYAENQAARQIPMKMADWVAKLDAFLQFNEYEVLANAGKVSAEVAKRLADEHYDKFRVRQDREFKSDFEAEVKRIESKRTRTREGGAVTSTPRHSEAAFETVIEQHLLAHDRTILGGYKVRARSCQGIAPPGAPSIPAASVPFATQRAQSAPSSSASASKGSART